MSTNGAATQVAASSAVNVSALSNKVALITGASSGLGRAIAQAYAAAGAYVVSGDITPTVPVTPLLAETMKARGASVDLTTPTVDWLNKKYPTAQGGPRAIYVHCDVTKPESIEAAVKATVAQYGRLDIMVNNAGIAAETNLSERLHQTPVDNFDKTLAINTRGVWLGIKYAVSQMLAQAPHPSGDRGWIINVSSIYGLVGSPGLTSYCTSKGAVTNLTRAAALEYATDRIHINSLHPGFAETALLEPIKAGMGSEQATKFIADLHPVVMSLHLEIHAPSSTTISYTARSSKKPTSILVPAAKHALRIVLAYHVVLLSVAKLQASNPVDADSGSRRLIQFLFRLTFLDSLVYYGSAQLSWPLVMVLSSLVLFLCIRRDYTDATTAS
ncbi:hypothetical protein DV737_g2849, partial [Chaetothyriales sp. CBS 132003]